MGFDQRRQSDIITFVNHRVQIYSLQLFYTAFRTNWIYKISQVFEVYHKTASAVYVTQPHIFMVINVKSYDYHVMSQHKNNIEIRIIQINWKMSHFTIHDGPGSLSPTLFKAEYNTDIIQTSALEVTAVYNRRHVLTCVNYQQGLIEARSNKLTNTVCLATITHRSEIGMHVKTFQFYGPTVSTVLSPSVCQYGGLDLKFGSSNTYSELCESVDNYVLSSVNRSISFIVVWFAGYSQGEIIAHLSLTDCTTMYPELVMSQKTLLKPTNLIYPHLLVGCITIVCPALQNRYQETCILKLGPPALGSVQISLATENILTSCEPSYLKTTKANFSIKTVSMNNWPLTLRNNVSHTFHNLDDYFEKSFDYLHSATIYLLTRATEERRGNNTG